MTKIEEVARAICEAEGRYSHWKLYIDAAKAAIQAMREPTVEMIEDGADILEKYNTSYRAVRDTFRAMIDQVLAEGGNS